jgi:Calpain family cysteine protease
VLDSVAEGAVGIDWRGAELRNSTAGVTADWLDVAADEPEAAGAAGERYSAPIDLDRLPTRQEAYQQARADFEVSHGRGRGSPLDTRALLPDDIALPEVAQPEGALPDQVEVPEAEEADESGAGADGAEPDYGPAGDAPGEARLVARVDAPDLPTPGPASDYGPPPARPDGTPIPCFDGPPAREQTAQGRLGDCGVIATIGAIAAHRPEAIRDCVRPNDDGSYEVRLHETRYVSEKGRAEPTGRMITLAVTKDLPMLDESPDKPAFADPVRTGAMWSPVLEKALAGVDQTWSDGRNAEWNSRWSGLQELGEVQEQPAHGYGRLSQGSTARDRAEILTQVTGEPALNRKFPKAMPEAGLAAESLLAANFWHLLDQDKPILVGTRPMRDDEARLPHRLFDSHAYEVVAVTDDNKIQVRNPWNRQHPELMTPKQFMDNFQPYYTTLE